LVRIPLLGELCSPVLKCKWPDIEHTSTKNTGLIRHYKNTYRKTSISIYSRNNTDGHKRKLSDNYNSRLCWPV
ncbi:MAG: hypothetical protein COW65_13760, partial [Cytophagales bacterium CG18_big_fil_WC_8_21_14_2_50_42_9]